MVGVTQVFQGFDFGARLVTRFLNAVAVAMCRFMRGRRRRENHISRRASGQRVCLTHPSGTRIQFALDTIREESGGY